MKKVLALLLAAAMCAAALTGCGGGDKPKETEKPDNGKSDTTASTKPDTKSRRSRARSLTQEMCRRWYPRVGRPFPRRT